MLAFLLFSGRFPLGPEVCVLWATMDVLMCTASIWHMCTMSMDRFFTLKYPMKYGRNKTRTMVTLKIMFVWVISFAICCPVLILGFLDYSAVFNNGLCAPTIRSFILYGSIFAFYIPLTIMVVTYVLTIKILCDNQKLMKSIVKDHSRRKIRREKIENFNENYLNPNMYLPRFLDHGSLETSISGATSVNDMSMPSNTESAAVDRQTNSESKPLISQPEEADQAEINQDVGVPKSPSSAGSAAQSLLGLPNTDLQNNRGSLRGGSPGSPGTMSVSQPHLPGMCTLNISWPHLVLPRAKSQQIMSCRTNSNSSIPQSAFVSAGSSLDCNSSPQLWGSACHCSDFEAPEILEKLSQIEQEMDDCLRESIKGESVSLSSQNLEDKVDTMVTATTCQEPDTQKSQEFVTSQVEVKPLTPVQDLPTPVLKYDVPPVTVTSPPVTSSDDTLDDTDSEDDDSDLITIHLKATGCYLYKIDPTKTSILSKRKCYSQEGDFDHRDITGNGRLPKADSTEQSGDDDLDETSISTSTGNRIYHRSLSRQGSKAWQAILRFSKREPKYKPNGALKQFIPKRTANNEKKASKVLGVIFAVFVVLWTPFFIVNILSVVCRPCLNTLTPTMMAAIVWLGYMSSLANPIIYTMFNTAFRNAFYKILTCSYKKQYMRARGSTPDTFHMVNATNWTTERTTDRTDRRNTLTLTLKDN